MGSVYLSKQVKLQRALEMVRKKMEEALTQEVNVGKKTIIWKVRDSWNFRRLAFPKDPSLGH